MASYALLNDDNFVTSVISGVDETIFVENNHPEIYYSNLYNCTVKRTSYNTKGNIHYNSFDNKISQDQSKAFRKNYAGIGYYYDSIRDAFIPPKPYNSWVLNEDTCLWESPIPYPNDGNMYEWNEETLSWDLANI